MRRWRRSLAAWMIVGFLSAQFISLAHACMNGLEAHGAVVTHVASEATHSADCPAMAQGGISHAACDAQCVPREQADKAADVRIMLAPPSVLVVRVVGGIIPDAVRAMPPRATIASPPISLLFGRFLI